MTVICLREIRGTCHCLQGPSLRNLYSGLVPMAARRTLSHPKEVGFGAYSLQCPCPLVA